MRRLAFRRLLRQFGLLALLAVLGVACTPDRSRLPAVSSAPFCVVPAPGTMVRATPQVMGTSALTSSVEVTPTESSNLPCNLGVYVADVTIPDGTLLSPGASFVKTWRIRNGGSCNWTPDYWMAFAGGDRMGAPLAVPLTKQVIAPNEELKVSVNMTAPRQAGRYKGQWTLCDAGRTSFGFGHGRGQVLTIWVAIQVVDHLTPTVASP